MQSSGLQDGRILIVDDQPTNIILLERILTHAGYSQIRSVADSRHALRVFLDWQPDLVLLDLAMPHMSGHTVLLALKSVLSENAFVPILVLTADISREAKERALSLGANDFLAKPLDVTEVLLRISNLLSTRFLHLRLEHYNAALEARVRERTRELEAAQVEILQRLAMAAEYRDDTTGRHTFRVGQLAAALARKVGLPEAEVELIRLAAPLHDLGKVGIRDRVLLKPGKLSSDEYREMKAHVSIGARILSGSHFPLLRMAETIALTHHERWDGTGYPEGLRGDQIPLVSRLVAVADVFDALTHQRPYKSAWNAAEALEALGRERGLQFDPDVVDALQVLFNEGYFGSTKTLRNADECVEDETSDCCATDFDVRQTACRG